ncbi:MAG: RNA-directed DNA polymerase [Devosiaceae bacterium]|nr:RNA-directed DNA polymerase [Devosiaceae bacterium]
MFKLTEEELEYAFASIKYHGFSTLFPAPPEWDDLENHWDDIKNHLKNEDLDIYEPSSPMRVFAPKSRFNLRIVTHLHPIDLVIYTALVLIVKDDIEVARIPKSKNIVYSFRADAKKKEQLYQNTNNYKKYKLRLKNRAEMASCCFVAIADIADFYPRIYQHRLENVIETVATTPRAKEVARVLVKKFINKIASGASYGIPVGPYASRNLAEALLIDVDSALAMKKFKLVRWVDDFAFFCKTDAEAQHCLFYLSQWLFEKHGLTLQSAKTKIVTSEHFLETTLRTQETKLEEKAEVIKDLWGEINPYEEDGVELDENEIEELENTSFREIIEEALGDNEQIDYDMISFILGRLSNIGDFKDEWRETFVDIILDNIEHLYPVSDSIATFFQGFEALNKKEKRKIARALLRPILSSKTPPPDYYTMWVLSIFLKDNEWNNSDKLIKIFTETHSEVVRRYAALAIEKNGKRAEALSVQELFERASPLLKLAILRTTRLLGRDERRFWKQKQLISGVLEKRI